MRMTKLTLSADRELVGEAKKLALAEGTSLSSMFARFLGARLSGRRSEASPGPLTRKATGIVKLPTGRSDQAVLEEALTARYRRGR